METDVVAYSVRAPRQRRRFCTAYIIQVPNQIDRGDAPFSRNPRVAALDQKNGKTSNFGSTRSSGRATFKRSMIGAEASDHSSDGKWISVASIGSQVEIVTADSYFLPSARKRRTVSPNGTVDAGIDDTSVTTAQSNARGAVPIRQSRTSVRADDLLNNVNKAATNGLARSETRAPSGRSSRPFDATALVDFFTRMATKMRSTDNLSCKIGLQIEDDLLGNRAIFGFDVRDPTALDEVLNNIDEAPAVQCSIKIELMREKAA